MVNIMTDIKTKEQWLGILGNQDPANNFDTCIMNAAVCASKEQLKHLAIAFPNLVMAIKEHELSWIK